MTPTAEAKQRYDNGYRQEKSEAGAEFADFLMATLIPHGLIIQNYTSKKYQIGRGENPQGIEIKHDMKFRQTGNLYIEVAEKGTVRSGDYVKSGIYRSDNQWLYLIGDFNTVWLFSTKGLRHLQPQYEKKETPTSQGFVIPLADADKFCLRKIEFGGYPASWDEV